MNTDKVLNDLKAYLGFNSDAELARALEVSPQNLSAWRKRDSLNVNKLVDKYPELSEAWLRTGVGEMLVSEASDTADHPRIDSPPHTPPTESDRLDALIATLRTQLEKKDEQIRSLLALLHAQNGDKKDAPPDDSE